MASRKDEDVKYPFVFSPKHFRTSVAFDAQSNIQDHGPEKGHKSASGNRNASHSKEKVSSTRRSPSPVDHHGGDRHRSSQKSRHKRSTHHHSMNHGRLKEQEPKEKEVADRKLYTPLTTTPRLLVVSSSHSKDSGHRHALQEMQTSSPSLNQTIPIRTGRKKHSFVKITSHRQDKSGEENQGRLKRSYSQRSRSDSASPDRRQDSFTSYSRRRGSSPRTSAQGQSSTAPDPNSSDVISSCDEGEIFNAKSSHRLNSTPATRGVPRSDHWRPAHYWRPVNKSTPALRGVPETDRWRPGDSSRYSEDSTTGRMNSQGAENLRKSSSAQARHMSGSECASGDREISTKKSPMDTSTQLQESPPVRLEVQTHLPVNDKITSAQGLMETPSANPQTLPLAGLNHTERKQALDKLRLIQRDNTHISNLFKPFEDVLKQKPYIRASRLSWGILSTPNLSVRNEYIVGRIESDETLPLRASWAEQALAAGREVGERPSTAVEPPRLSWAAQVLAADQKARERSTVFEGEAPRTSWAAQAMAAGQAVSDRNTISEAADIELAEFLPEQYTS